MRGWIASIGGTSLVIAGLAGAPEHLSLQPAPAMAATFAVDAKTLAGQHESIGYVGSNSLALTRIVINAQEVVRSDNLALVVGPTAIPIATYENPPASAETPAGDLPIASQFVLNRIDPRLAAFDTLRVYTATLDPALFAAPQAAMPAPVAVTLTDVLGTNIAPFGALAYGARDNPGALIAGAGATVYVSTAATPALGTLVPTADTFTGSINALVFDPDNSTHFYAAQGTTIEGTVNSGVKFTDLHGNLPASFQNVNAAEFISSNGVRALFAGGSNAVADAQSTVYVLLANALGQWTPFSTGLPNALVNQLTYTPEADLLLVATLGRGAWAIYDVTSNFASATQLQFGFAGNDSAPGASQLADGIDASGNAFSRPLVKQGAGVLTLAISATYTGATTIKAGRCVQRRLMCSRRYPITALRRERPSISAASIRPSAALRARARSRSARGR